MPVSASASALVTASVMKRHLRITSSSDDDLIQQLINQASELFERAADRKFTATNYIEFVNSNNLATAVVKHYPIIYVTRVASGRQTALTAEYTGSAIRALISVTDDAVRLVTTSAAGVSTTSSLTFATYPTLSTMRAAIDAVADWTATLSGDDGLSSNLYRYSGINANDRVARLEWPDHDLEFYEVRNDSGVIRIGGRNDQFCQWPSPANGGTVMVEYRAGYETIPEDVQMVVVDMVSAAFSRTGDTSQNGTARITSETLGDYSRTLSDTSTTTEGAAAELHRVLGENAAVVDRYRNHAVAGVC